MEQVKKFKYLGAVIFEDGKMQLMIVKQMNSHGQGSIQQKKRVNNWRNGSGSKEKTCESSCMTCGTIWVRNMDIEKGGDRQTKKLLKCGYGEEWMPRSAGKTRRKMKKCLDAIGRGKKPS